MLGVTAGLLIRRALPAMAVTLAIVAVVQFAAPLWVRPHLGVAVSYLPVSRYWPLQFAETGFFLALALALAWYCFWRLNRRLS